MKKYQYFLNYKNNEAKIEDDAIIQSMDEFYDLQQEIDELTEKLKQAKSKFSKYNEQINPIIDAMKETNDRLAETDKYIIKVKKFSYDRSSTSYKDAFEMALSKVNTATKNVLNEALEASKSITHISHSIEISLAENILINAIKSIKSYVKSFLNIFKVESKKIDDANEILKKLSNTKM